MDINDWAATWGVSNEALKDLENRLIQIGPTPTKVHAGSNSETAVQNDDVYSFCLETGGNLWRNNVGVASDNRGNFVRFGLANDSRKINKVLKSADRIGIKPVIITQEMVGTTVGQFVSREYKKAGHVWRNTPHEKAQMNWANLVNLLGGDAKIVTREKV